MPNSWNISRRRFLEWGGAAGLAAGVPQIASAVPAMASLPPVAEKDAIIAFGYIGPASDEGWTWAHEQGRQAVQKAFPAAKTVIVESIPYSADASRTFRQFVEDGAHMVITNSNYGDFLYDVAKRAPQTAFLHCDDRTVTNNMGAFYPSHWYPSYVTGVAAGVLTKSNRLGYIASFPVPTCFSGSNAFLMGAQSVQPNAKLQVIAISSWFDPQGATQAARALIDNGADVLFGIMDEPGYLQVAEQRDVKAVMLNTDTRKYGQKAYMSSIIFDFRKFFVEQVTARLAGRWQPGIHLLPFGDGADRDAWGMTIPPEAAQVADAARAKILNGWSPFVGELKTNRGVVKIAAGQQMSEIDVYNWNWSIEGVTGL